MYIEKAIIKLKDLLCVNLFKHRIEIMMLWIYIYSVLFVNLSKFETIHTNWIMICWKCVNAMAKCTEIGPK